MLVIAHRGLSAHYPENTMVAFEKAIESGARALECDVHQVDDNFVIFHDFYLKRLTGVAGTLALTDMQALSQLRISGTDSHIPSLQEVFTLCAGKVLLNLELKMINDPKLLVETLCDCFAQFDDEKGPLEIVLSSFNHPLLQAISLQLRDTPLTHAVKLAALIAHLPIDHAQYAIDLHADIAALDAHLISADFVKHAHQHYMKVWCYTVNQEDLLMRLFEMGVDGIFSDDVKWANDIIHTSPAKP